jgi:hypothetical membrane protein
MFSLYNLLSLILIQYYIIQIVVSKSIENYSFVTNVISLLGDTKQSPRHTLMNFSFCTNGIIFIILGILLHNTASSITQICTILSGIGALLVGLNPEDGNFALHATGAALSFLFGNASLLSLAYDNCHSQEKTQEIYKLGGIIGFLALPAFVISQNFTSLNTIRGLLERATSSPQSIVVIVVAIMDILQQK